MKRSKNILILVLAVFSVLATTAQKNDTALAELQKIKDHYAGKDLKYVGGKMTLKNVKDNKIVDKVDFEYWTKGKKIVAMMGYLEILVNEEVYIMVNNKHKTIYGRNLSQLQQKPDMGFFDPQLLGKLLNTKNATAVIKREAGISTLTLSGLPDSRFSSVKIIYSSIDHSIISIDATVAPAADMGTMLLQVVYNTTTKEKTALGEEKFSAAKYIERSGNGNYTYTKQYNSYQKL